MFLKIVDKYLVDKTVIFILHDNLFDKYVNKIYQLEGGELVTC